MVLKDFAQIDAEHIFVGSYTINRSNSLMPINTAMYMEEELISDACFIV